MKYLLVLKYSHHLLAVTNVVILNVSHYTTMRNLILIPNSINNIRYTRLFTVNNCKSKAQCYAYLLNITNKNDSEL